MKSSVVWILASRPRTLVAAVVPVAVGTALAAHEGAAAFSPALFCLLFALLIQVGTNFANDYFDFMKGADRGDRRGPLRVTATGLVSPWTMQRAFIAVFIAAFAAGLPLVAFGGWWLLPLGMVCVLAGLAYTAGPFPLAYNGLGDVFVFAFFGIVAVTFTYYVQAGSFSAASFLAAVAVGALSTNILLVNNYRDRDTDIDAGKNTLVVLLGERFSLVQYAVLYVLAFLAPVALFFSGFSFPVLIPLVLAPLAARLVYRLPRAVTGPEYNALLEGTAKLMILYGALFSVGIVLG
ncbi:MAG: 1,4-dihydroxy-2-naphthoate polyprenyltransferase [Opitutales bacterium]